MELFLTESLLYVPPLILSVLVALYRNNILCFWDCHPVGVATKDFVKDVVVKMTDIQKIAVNMAVAIRNFSTSIQTTIRGSLALVAQTIRSTALMIVNKIQGILITIRDNLHLILQRTLDHLQLIVFTIKNTSQQFFTHLYNKTISIVTPPKPVSQDHAIIFGVTVLLVLAFLWLGYKFIQANRHRNRIPQDEKPIVQEEEKPRRYPIRRRVKKTDA